MQTEPKVKFYGLPPCVIPLGNFQWKLRDSIAAMWTHNEVGYLVTIPPGFRTDFCSTPRALWAMFPPFDTEYLVPALLHDYVYAVHLFTRADADEFFRDAMEAIGTPLLKRRILFDAVRVGGADAYASGPSRAEAQCFEARP